MNEMDAAAGHFETLLQQRFLKAMKQLQAETSINELAILIANKKPVVIDSKRIKELMGPISKAMLDAFRHGGKLGAKKVPRG
jgi:hypothetical protein